MINAVERDHPGMPDHGFSAGPGRQVDVEAFVSRRGCVLQEVPVHPQDRVAGANARRNRAEFQFVDDDRVNPGRGCRRTGGGQGHDGSR